MKKEYKRILVINTFGIGDVLFSTPMVAILKKNIPEACIDFMCNERCRHIVENNKNIRDVLIFEKDHFRETARKSKIAFIKKFYKGLKKIKKKGYNLAIDLSLGYQISLFLMLLGVKKRIGFNYRDRGRFLTDKLEMYGFKDKHAVLYYTDILKLIGISDTCKGNLELEASPASKKWADDFLKKNGLDNKTIVGIAPGGGKSWGEYAIYRRWDPQNFAYVARELTEKGKNIFFIILGSTDETSLSRVIKDEIRENCVDLCGKLSLPHSIALIQLCRLLLCNDGGLLHIAVSQGVNTVSIFGPVDDNVYGPYPSSDKHKVIKADASCRPCYSNFRHKICETHDCLKKIDRDYVAKIAKDSLGLK